MNRRKFLQVAAAGSAAIATSFAPEWVMASEPRSRFTLHFKDDLHVLEADVDGEVFIDWIQAFRLSEPDDSPWVTAIRWREPAGEWQVSNIDVIENGRRCETVLAPIAGSRPKSGPTTAEWGTDFFGFQQLGPTV